MLTASEERCKRLHLQKSSIEDIAGKRTIYCARNFRIVITIFAGVDANGLTALFNESIPLHQNIA